MYIVLPKGTYWDHPRTRWSLPHVCCTARRDHQRPCRHVWPKGSGRHVANTMRHIYINIYTQHQVVARAKLFQFNIVHGTWRRLYALAYTIYSDCQLRRAFELWTEAPPFGTKGGTFIGRWLVLCAKLMARWHLLIWSAGRLTLLILAHIWISDKPSKCALNDLRTAKALSVKSLFARRVSWWFAAFNNNKYL